MLAGIHVQVTISDSSLSCRQGVVDSSIPNVLVGRAKTPKTELAPCSERFTTTLLRDCYAAFQRLIRIPALVARVISISRLNFSHSPLVKSETLG